MAKRRALMSFDADGVRQLRCPCGFTASGNARGVHACPLLDVCGPGCQLAKTFAWFGLRDDERCGCSAYAAQMDAWGPTECERRLEEIVEHLRGAAAKRGLPFIATAARIAVARACESARREADAATKATAPGEHVAGPGSG